MLNKNIYIQKTYKEYLENLNKNNNKLISQTLNDYQVETLRQSKYNLTQFEIYLFIKSLDYLRSQNNEKINLIEGITEDKNLFRNVLVDLYYQNINDKEVFNTPITYLFGFNYYNNKPQNIETLSLNLGENNNRLLDNIYFIKNTYKSYFGNYDTYVTLKELIKIYLNNINLYYYNGKLYNELQLIDIYDLNNEYYRDYGSKWFVISNLDPLLKRFNYNLLSIEDPSDITKDSLSEIKIKFTLQNIDNNYDLEYTINFKLKDFWISKYKL